LKLGLFERVSRFVLIIALFTSLVTLIESHLKEDLTLLSARVHPTVAYTWGFSLGLRDFAVENAKCIWTLITHPIATISAMGHAVIQYEETYNQIEKSVKTTWQRYPDMPIGQKARLHSRLVAESLYLVGAIGVPSVGLSKIKSLSVVTSKARLVLEPAVQKVVRPVTRLTSKNSSQIGQTIGFAEWFAYEN